MIGSRKDLATDLAFAGTLARDLTRCLHEALSRDLGLGLAGSGKMISGTVLKLARDESDALAVTSDIADARALVRDLRAVLASFRDLDLDLARVLARALDLARALARVLGRDGDVDLVRVRVRDVEGEHLLVRDLDLTRARVLACDLGHAIDEAVGKVEVLTRATERQRGRDGAKVRLGPVRLASRINCLTVGVLPVAARARYRDELLDELYDLVDQRAPWRAQVACALRQLTTVRRLCMAARATQPAAAPAAGAWDGD